MQSLKNYFALMNMRTAAAVACLGLLLSGCAENVDTNLIKYQKSILARSPQKRIGKEGLDSLRPAPSTTGPALKVEKDPETGKSRIYLTLEEAIVRCLANSLDIRVASFDPSIAREDLLAAQAVFDLVAFGEAQAAKNDQQLISPTSYINPLKSATYQAGVKELTPLGGSWAFSWQIQRELNRIIPTGGTTTQDIYFWDQQVSLQATQPLLRNAGLEYNLAQIHLSALNEQASYDVFRKTVEDTVDKVITAYLNLIQARVDYQIQQDLLDNTITTLNRVRARSELDATAVQIKQAEAAVESRRALLIDASKTIQDAQDSLAILLADAQINLLGKCEIIPITPPIITDVHIDSADKLITALKYNPVLDQARLAIQAAVINVKVAWNQTLPRLDLAASVNFDGSAQHSRSKAWDNMTSGDYASYSLGLTAEYPIGNRAAIAELRKQKFNRLKSITTLQNLADQLTLIINERIRQVATTYDEMQAQRRAVEAFKVQLQALEDTERIRGRLTPEFLQLKLSAQESLAQAQHAELLATIQYNIALSDLDRTTGTILQTQRVKIALPAATYMDYSAWPGEPPTPKTKPASRPSEPVVDAYRRALQPMEGRNPNSGEPGE